MAKRIKFPLDMKDGIMVRTLEELQENFDVEKLVGHWLSGKLQMWLSDRHYEKHLEKIKTINTSSKTAINELCQVLNIYMGKDKINVETDKIIKQQEKVKVVRQYTDDKEIMDHIDEVAMNQEELDVLLSCKCSKVFLLGEVFYINNELKKTALVGINNPIIVINTDFMIDFNKNEVQFYKCTFDEKYLTLLEEKRIEEENLHKKKRMKYVPSSTFDYLLSENDRKQCKSLYDKVQEEMTEFEFDIDIGTKKMYKLVTESDFNDTFNIDLYGKKIKEIVDQARLNRVWENFLDKIS